MKLTALVRLYGLAAIALVASAQEKFELKDTDRVVFYGDSITDQTPADRRPNDSSPIRVKAQLSRAVD